MVVSSKIRDLLMRIITWVGIPIVAFLVLFLAGADLAPSWQAHSGGGTPGIFTAVKEDCGRGGCDYIGSWQATDGGRRRDDVRLYDEPDSLTIGGQTEAIDSGARMGVFAAAGGSTYLLITGLVLASAATAVGWIFFLGRAVRRGRARSRADAATAGQG
jgi:hypothetical protein